MSISSPTSPTSSERWRIAYYRRLKHAVFAAWWVGIGYLLGSAVCIGYLLGSAGGGGRTNAGPAHGVDPGRLPAHPEADGAAMGGGPGDGGERTGVGKEPRRPAYAKGAVVHEHMGKGTSISLIGERHSGTKWITDHLVDCVSVCPCLQ